MRVLTHDDVVRDLPRIDVLASVREAFASLGRGSAIQPRQQVVDLPGGGDVISYFGALLEREAIAVKVSPYLPHPDGARLTAWTVVLSSSSGEPLLMCDSLALTTERTAATTALAVDALAPGGSPRLAVIGSGAIARAHLRYAIGLRDWSDVAVWSPSLADAPARQSAVRESAPAARIAESRRDAVGRADVVLCCTSSAAPVIDPDELREDALVTSITTSGPGAHEVPPDWLSRVAVYCDYRPTCPVTAGEMIAAASSGAWSADAIVGDLAEIAVGAAGTRPPGPAFFRSTGLGIEDAAVACALIALPDSRP